MGKKCRKTNGEESEGEEQGENGIRKPKKRQDPKEPTQAEREEHEKTHIRSEVGVSIAFVEGERKKHAGK